MGAEASTGFTHAITADRRSQKRRAIGQSVRMGSMDHVKLPIVVRKAMAGDVASMQAVDVEARQRFRDVDDARIARAADDQPYWTEGLTRAATEQRVRETVPRDRFGVRLRRADLPT